MILQEKAKKDIHVELVPYNSLYPVALYPIASSPPVLLEVAEMYCLHMPNRGF